MGATVASTSGWQTRLALGAPRRFHGNHAALDADLDLGSLLALVRSVQKATDVGGAYTLTLAPHVSASGRLGGGPVCT